MALSNGAFTAADRTVLSGWFTYDVAPNGPTHRHLRLRHQPRLLEPALLLVPVVGPTLVPAQYSDNTLCIYDELVPLTNQWVGTSRVDFVAGPVFAPGVPLDFPVLQPRPVCGARRNHRRA